MTGHLLGGAGGIETVFTALTVYEGIIPPTINLENPGDECNLDYVANLARKKEVKFSGVTKQVYPYFKSNPYLQDGDGDTVFV